MNPAEADARSAAPLSLWVVPVPEIGGVARHVLDVLAVGLPGVRLALLCPEGPLAQEARTLGAAVFTGDFGPAAGLRASVSTLRRHVRALRPDLVHTHLAYADLVAAIVLATDRRTALISTEHGIAPDNSLYNSHPLAARVKNAAHRLRFRRTQHVIAVCESTRQVLQNKWAPPCPITVVRNGVDIDAVRAAATAPRRSTGEGLRVLSLSRLAPEKGLDVLLTAFARLREYDQHATLTIAGTGDLLGVLQEHTDQLGVAEAVSFPGFVEPWTTMAHHDVLVQLSAWENLSYSLLDAAAAEMPAVATDVGGNGEILPAEHLVPTGDPTAVLAAVTRATAKGAGTGHADDREAMVRTLAKLTLDVSERGQR
ncbi:MAG: glycosyltransferase [Micrococcus sp.]|nr:glycosyltransferase [Micrococcus sp.]